MGRVRYPSKWAVRPVRSQVDRLRLTVAIVLHGQGQVAFSCEGKGYGTKLAPELHRKQPTNSGRRTPERELTNVIRRQLLRMSCVLR